VLEDTNLVISDISDFIAINFFSLTLFNFLPLTRINIFLY